jgi:hypothetical protein
MCGELHALATSASNPTVSIGQETAGLRAGLDGVKKNLTPARNLSLAIHSVALPIQLPQLIQYTDI